MATLAIPATSPSCRRLKEGCLRGVGPVTRCLLPPSLLLEAARGGGAAPSPPPSCSVGCTSLVPIRGCTVPAASLGSDNRGYPSPDPDASDPAPTSSSMATSKAELSVAEWWSTWEGAEPLPDPCELLDVATTPSRALNCSSLPLGKSPSAASSAWPSSSSGDTQNSMSSARQCTCTHGRKPQCK